MVLESEAVFQQFVHCKFRETVVRVLYIEERDIFITVTKWGNVATYKPSKMSLEYVFQLDLEPMGRKKRGMEFPTCQRTHVVVDAAYAMDIESVIFVTSKGVLQCYDIGELDREDLGVGLTSRGQFLKLSDEESPVAITSRNHGFTETHRICYLPTSPTCMIYEASKLIVGDMDGCIHILEIRDIKYPFLGKRKIRGELAIISVQDVLLDGCLKQYQGHNEPVKSLSFISSRNLILSVSRDQRFSLFGYDCCEISDSFIISLPKGINSLAHSTKMNMIATGSMDGSIRIFSQFELHKPYAEWIEVHKAPILSLEMVPVPFSEDKEYLLSYSEDAMIRAFDPLKQTCIQTIFIRFPPGIASSTIICKTPEFAKKSLFLHPREKRAFVLALYSNSYAKLYVGKDESYWPFDFEILLKEIKEVEKHMKKSRKSKNMDPTAVKLASQDKAEVKLQAQKSVEKLMELRRSGKEEANLFRKPSLTSIASSAFSSMSRNLEKRTQEQFGLPRSPFNELKLYEIDDIKLPPEPEGYL